MYASFFTPIDGETSTVDTDKENRNVINLYGPGDVSPLTTETESSLPSLPKKKKLHRKSPRQASVARLEQKEQKDEYATRFGTAFKEATNLVAVKLQQVCCHSTLRICR